MSHLLPPNATAFEKALAEQSARLTAIPVPLRQLWNPYTCPASHLAWLAWTFSVDYWDESWPVETQRNVIARAVWLHQKKGTLGGIAAHVEIADGKVLKAITPPAKTYLMPRLTDAEHERFLDLFAQLRIYPFVARANYRFGHFTSKAFGRDKAFLSGAEDPGVGYVKELGAWSRWLRTATLWDRGEETTLTIRAVTPEGLGRFHAAAYDEVILAPKPTRAIHLNAPPKAVMHLIDDFGVAQRIVQVPRDDSYEFRLGRETYTTTYPNAELIDVRPQSVAEPHDGQPGALYNGRKQFIAGHHLPPTIAWRYLYERWHIHDPERAPDVRMRSTHLGFTRLGMPAYHAELKTKLRGERKPRVAGSFVDGFLVTGDRRPIAKVREAVRISKSFRDKILLDTKTYRSPQAGDRLKVGSIKIGTYIEA